MEANFDEQSLDLSEAISKFGNHPVIEKLMIAMSKVHSENPQLTANEMFDAIAQKQSIELTCVSSGHMQDNHLMETDGLYEPNIQPDPSFALNTSYEPNLNQKFSFEPQFHTLTNSTKVGDHLQQLNLNSSGNNRCFTINMDDLQDDPLNVPPRPRAVKSKRKATGRSIIAHDHQYSSSTFGSSTVLEDSMHRAAENACRVPLSQGFIYPSDEVLSFPDYHQHAMSIHPQVAPEMKDVFEVSHTGYLDDFDTLSLDENTNSARPVTPLFPEDTFNSNRGYMLPQVVDELKEEIPSPISADYCSLLDGQYDSTDPLHYGNHIICKSRESSRAGTPAQSFNSNSNLHSPFPQVTYFDDASTPSPSPSTPQSLNYDSLMSPSPSCSSSCTTNLSPSLSPSTRGRSRNNSSTKRLGRPRRLSSSSSTSISREPRVSLVNWSESEKNARVRDQNNKASREYRMRRKSKLSELETEVNFLEEKQKLKKITLSDAEKKLILMKKLVAEAQKRGIIPTMSLRGPQLV